MSAMSTSAIRMQRAGLTARGTKPDEEAFKQRKELRYINRRKQEVKAKRAHNEEGASLETDSCYWQCVTDVDQLDSFWYDTTFAAPKTLRERADVADEWRSQQHKEMKFAGGEGQPYINAKDVKLSYGLSEAEALRQMSLFGTNELTPPPEKPEIVKFLEQFTGFFSLLLEAGGILCFVAYGVDPSSAENLYLGIVLWKVVIITSIFTYCQESASEAMMEKFKSMDQPKARIRRGGKDIEVEFPDVVPGDLLKIGLGEKIPCDCRVVEPRGGFSVTEAALTGEPFAITKIRDCGDQKTKYAGTGRNVGRSGDNSWDALCKDKDKGPALRQSNIIMNGTDIEKGEAWVVAVTTGDQTIMGRNYQMMLETKSQKDETPIKKEINRFVEIITMIAVCLGVTFFIITVAMDGWKVTVNAIVFTIGIIVANVPEGLLATVTVSLALTAERMKDVMVLVKNLEAVETLGSTSVICSDKTGTLTQNKMTVVKAFVSGENYSTHPIETADWKGGTQGPQGDARWSSGQNPFYELMKCSILCGTAKFRDPEDPIKAAGAKQVTHWEELDWASRDHQDGDASERALLVFNERRLKEFKNKGVSDFSGSDLSALTGKSDSPIHVNYSTVLKGLGAKKDWEAGKNWQQGSVDTCDYLKYGSLVKAARQDNLEVDAMPFDSKNKWMAITSYMGANAANGEHYVSWIKGGSDVVYDFCTHTIKNGEVTPLTNEDNSTFEEANQRLAGDGLRVFAFAKVAIDSLNEKEEYKNGPPEKAELKKYFDGKNDSGVGGMRVTDDWAPGEVNEKGDTPTGEKPVTVLGKPQIPLVRPDLAALRVEKNKDYAFVPKVVFLGMLALQDPPRPAVPRAVSICRNASIGVVMVTGDQPQTAAAIARNIGIIAPGGKTEDDVLMDQLLSEPGMKIGDFKENRKRLLSQMKPEQRDSVTAMAVEGPQIGDWSPSAMDLNWKNCLKFVEKGYDGLVFARTSPTQKLLIVRHFKLPASEDGPEKIVAVTGDGVNDAQAVTAADIGICMGIAGMAVTKEAADMILMNDNFASIVDGVLEGRLIFDNLKKSIAYTLSSNIPEISPFIVFILLQVPLPLSTVLILCIDLGTDMVPAISLAYEGKERDIMKRPPRTKHDNLVTMRLISFSYFQIGMVQALAGFYVYMCVFYSEGIAPADLLYHGQLADYFKWSTGGGGHAFGGFTLVENGRQLAKAQSAFWVSIVIVQWADILICKTRRLSLFDQGMKNDQLNFGLFFETALAVCLIYIPGVATVFGIQKLRFIFWLPAMPFAVLIVTYDELRKWILRNFEGGWLDRKTYW